MSILTSIIIDQIIVVVVVVVLSIATAQLQKDKLNFNIYMALYVQAQLYLMLRWPQLVIKTSQVNKPSYNIKIMITHLLARPLFPSLRLLFRFGTASTSPPERSTAEQKFSTPLFKKNDRSTSSPTKSSKNTSQEQLQELIAKINESNKYFLGIRYNTNYLKVHNVAQLKDILQQTVTAAVKDLPADFSNNLSSFQQFQQAAGVMESRAAILAFSHCNKEAVFGRMQTIIKDYFAALTMDGRFKKVEPNFERQLIKLRNSLRSKCSLKLKDPQTLPQIKLSKITLLKGVEAYRNRNYSTDSYSRDQSEINDGIITYQLYKQRNERYPEIQWESTRKINARFEVLVKGGPSIQVTERDLVIGSTANVMHRAVFEADLVPPPAISEHQLSSQQYLRSYRLLHQNVVLTNFDHKNDFFGLTYSEAEKKESLINEIQ